MACAKAPVGTKSSTLITLTEDQKRWIVFGIALNHVLVPSIRPALEQEIVAEYNNLKSNYSIDVQVAHSFPAAKYRGKKYMKYENINANDTKLKPPHYKKNDYDYSKFDYRVKSHVDFGKLFLEIHMAKFNTFDETFDASAVLNLLGKIPIFSPALQNAANDVRKGRNAWGHCNFTEWNEANFRKIFDDMKNLAQEICLSSADKRKVLTNLKDWEDKGVAFCMNATVDADLAKVVQQHVCRLSSDLEKMNFESQKEMNNLKEILENFQLVLQELEKRVAKIEKKHDILQQEQNSTSSKVDIVEQRVTKLEDQKSTCIPQETSYYLSACEADLRHHFKRYHPDTRQWLLQEFHTWFNNPKESRAYVLLGDAAVSKSVIAAVIAQRAKDNGNLAAAFFCRHYDGTRRDPRYLLGSVAYQMCNCNSDYNKIVGGERAIQKMLANSKLGVQELFTTMLEEPLSKCPSFKQKLVVIDALDETEFWSRDDFLDLIMNGFHRLPNWLVIFITSRPENRVTFRLKTYSPCLKICAGHSESAGFYKNYEQDIERFLTKRVNFSNLPYSSNEIVKKCSGMFLYAFYMIEILNNPTRRSANEIPETMNDFFHQNFKRVSKTLGKDFYQKLFGCVLMAPSPLPISFISFLLGREGCGRNEQKIINAVSLFVRTTNRTFTFLHDLIPTWLTDEDRASRELFICRNEANTLFTNIMFDFLIDFLQDEGDKLLSVKPDVVNYILHSGFRFIRQSCFKTIFTCLTNYRFLQQRIRSSKVGVYYLIEDLEFSNRNHLLDENKKKILGDLCSVLKHDKHVIAGCPELLSSCLSNASELTQETILRNEVLASLIQPSMKLIDFPLNSFLCDIDCSAFSHDKKLLVAGLGRCFFMFDARTLRKLAGPIEVIDSEKLSHLEFSSDDKFVFFGRLDKWYSVQKGRVLEIAQFAGNVNYYKWGSFVYESSYIAVIKDEIGFVDLNSVGHIFLKWWLLEICLEQDEELKCVGKTDEIFCRIKDYRVRHFPLEFESCVLYELEELTSQLHMCLNLPCKFCQGYGEIKTARAQIIHLFANIFKYQIWNVKTGRPVIQEMFDKQLEPFFYLWHIFPSIKTSDSLCFDPCNTIVAAVVNLAAFITFSSLSEYSRSELVKISGLKVPYGPDLTCSRDGNFVAKKSGESIKLVETEYISALSLSIDILEISIGWAFRDIKYHCFTTDSNYFVYVTHKPNPNLYAFSLQTRETLQSISGVCPVVYASKEDKCFGYIFCRANERIIISLNSLSGNFLFGCLNCDTSKLSHPVEATTFTSTDTITLLFSNCMFRSWQIGVEVLALDAKVLEPLYWQNIYVKKCAFSHNGKLIAINHSYDILLFNCEGKLVSSVFKITEQNEHTVYFLTFSSDASLLLFCIRESNDNQSFYVWDVLNEVLSNRINLQLEIPIDCACFAIDNSKIFFCSASAVLIYHYPSNNCPRPKIAIPGKASLTCNHCVVSPDNQLLVCCIGNDILVHQLDGGNALWEVPHNHSGLIKSCKFLKGSRYLISCDMEGVILLFDLSERKSVAYARLQESVSTIAVSPDEDKIVCLGSSGKVDLINLHGLKCGSPSNFQKPSDFRLPGKNREPKERRGISPPSEIDFEMEDVLDEDAQLSPYSSESSDEEGLNDVTLTSG